MNKCMGSSVLAITLICSALTVDAMKRSLDDTREQASTILGTTQFPITQLPTEILQKVFGFLEYKLGFLMVCRMWSTIGNFDKWRSLINSSNIAYLTKDARIRMYRLLLANTNTSDVTTLDLMLANDPDCQKHMAEISTLVQTPLSKFIFDKNILNVLKKHQINIDDEEKSEDQLWWGTLCISQLCDTLLCNDQQMLDQFLANPNLTLSATNHNESHEFDFIIDSDLIPRYCSIDTVEKLIPLLKQINSGYSETDYDENQYTLADYLLYRALFGTVQRLDIADKLLKGGAQGNFDSTVSDKVGIVRWQVIGNQDAKVLSLLFQHNSLEYQDLCTSDVSVLRNTQNGLIKNFYDATTKSFEDCGQNDEVVTTSPLMFSVYLQKSAEFVRKLIEIGADPFEVDDNCGDILNVARDLGNKEIITVLQEARQASPVKLAQQWQ